MDRNNMNILVRLLSVGTTVCALLASCGGGGGGGNDTPAPNMFGVAGGISNAPLINGTVNVSCAKGSALATTNSTGAWQVALSGQTPPCAVEVSGGTLNAVPNTQFYHSIAVNQGTVNVTPLTDLMVANLAGTATPSTWFAGLSANPAPLTAITQIQVNTSLANLSTVLSGLPPLSAINPITTTLTYYSGNDNFDMVFALANAINSTSSTYATLLGDAATSTAAGPGFNAALLAAYTGITTSQPVTASNLSTNYVAQTGGSTNLTFVPDPNTPASQVLQMTLGANDLVAGSSHRTEITPYGGSVIVDTTAPANSINARWYAFNFYIPSGWVPITGGNIFAQIHGNDHVTPGNPVVALGADGSNLWLNLNYNTHLFGSATPPTRTNQTSNSVLLGTVTPGTWYLFVVYADWSYTPGKGSLSIWLNGTSIYSNTNTPNCFDTSYGSYPSNYAKTGIYAWNGLNSGQASAYVLSRGIVVADPSATYAQVVAAFPTTN